MSVLKLLVIFFAVAVLVLTAGLSIKWFLSHSVTYTVQPAVLSAEFKPPAQTPHLSVFLQASAGKQAWRCQDDSCQAVVAPGDLPEEAVTNGSAWFFYTENKEKRNRFGQTTTTLQKLGQGKEPVRDIISTTDLTSPRYISLSPSGGALAFFRDNIHDPKEKLTELWVYEEETSGVRLLAENLFQPDIRSNVRWNSSSSHALFLADNGERSARDDDIQLLTAQLHPPRLAASFSQIHWGNYTESFDNLLLDLDRTGQKLALAAESRLGYSQLVIAQDGEDDKQYVRGNITYLQWLENGDLLYAVQDRSGFTFWRKEGASDRLVARRTGELSVARSDPTGEFVTFIATGAGQLQVLHVTSGQVSNLAGVPSGKEKLDISHVIRRQPEASQAIAGVTAQLEDAELAAFIDKHLKEIAEDESVRPLRLLVTQQPNTVYLDIRTQSGGDKRLLLTVRDAVYSEWAIHARYRPVNGRWDKTEGGGQEDPAIQRLYEWEESLNRWILKKNTSP